MKVQDIIKASEILRKAKVTKMETVDKMAVVRTSVAIGRVAKESTNLIDELKEKMKDERHESMTARHEEFVQKHQGKKYDELTPDQLAELKELNAYFERYRDAVNDASREELERDVRPDIKPISEDAFNKLVESNDLTVEELAVLSEVFC